MLLITPNLTMIEHNGVKVYFSYETPIAFWDVIQRVLYVSENIWTRTTGKHINTVKMRYMGESIRDVTNDEFAMRLRNLAL